MSVKLVAELFSYVAGYLAIVGMCMLARPGSISMAAGAPILGGLEVAGPYVFLLMAAVAVVIGWGLRRGSLLAKRAGIVAAAIGIFMMVPSVSAAAIAVQWRPLAVSGFGVMVRAGVVWILWAGEN